MDVADYETVAFLENDRPRFLEKQVGICVLTKDVLNRHCRGSLGFATEPVYISQANNAVMNSALCVTTQKWSAQVTGIDRFYYWQFSFESEADAMAFYIMTTGAK